MVKDDKFVAAPARDQIARADNGAEPAGDLDQELVAGAVAEAIIDLLEIVEVEKHHGQAVAGSAVATKSECELLLETSAIGQIGDRVEPRHSVDFKLGVATFGDVLDDQDGALACHAMDGDLKGAIVERFERDDEVDPLVVIARQNGCEPGELRLGDNTGRDQSPQDRFHMRADGGVLGDQVEHLERLVVRQNEAAVGVQHAKAVRHVVEGHVEARRQHRGLLLRRNHRHEIVS